MKISNCIANELGNRGIIEKNDVDICRYGLEIFGSTISELFCIFVISLLVGNLKETLMFFLAFIPLRIYVGGYHADTKLKCFMVSLIVYVIFTIIIRILPEYMYLQLMICESLFSLVMVVLNAPIIHANKNVEQTERTKYKKVSLTVFVIETITAAILYTTNINKMYTISFVMGQLAVTMSMLAAILKDKIKSNK